MSDLVKKTSLTEQTIRKNMKEINKKGEMIKIDRTNKPYRYTIDVEFVLELGE